MPRAPGQQTVTLELRVVLQKHVETLWIGVDLLAGDLVLYAGEELVEVRAPPAENEVEDVQLSYVGPVLGVMPGQLQFATGQGRDPPAKALSVTNAGGGTLNWNVTWEAGWLEIAPTSGALDSGQTQALTVSPAASDLPLGTHSGTVWIEAPDVGGSEQVAVQLVVFRNPEIGLSTDLVFLSVQEDDDPDPTAVVVSNVGGGVLSWAASPDAAWVTLSPESGTLEAGESVTVSVGAEPPDVGSYVATVTVDDPAALNAPQTLTVHLSVTPRPEIVLSSDSLPFFADEGSSPEARSFTIANGGGGILRWQAAEAVPWLELAPGSGSLTSGQSTGVSVSVNSVDLDPGRYSETITLSDPEASNSPRTFHVSLTVRPGPEIALSTLDLSFATRVGVSPPAQSLAIANVGEGPLQWEVAEDEEWLSVAPGSGTLLAGESEDLTAIIQSEALEPGLYSGTVAVSAPDASNSPQSLSVTLEVMPEPGPLISLSRTSISFAAEKGTDPLEQWLTVANSGGGTLAWSAVTEASWLSLSPSQGTLDTDESQEIALSVESAALEPGVYQTEVILIDPGADNSPQTIEVALQVRPGPAIGAFPESLFFTALPGSDPEASDSFEVSNAGGGTLRWAAQGRYDCGGTACPFTISVEPTSGELGPGQKASVRVTLHSSGAPPGTYSGVAWVELSDPEASNSPQAVNVELDVHPHTPPQLSRIWYTVDGINSEACSYLDPPATLFTVRFDYEDRNGDVNQEQSVITVKYQFIGGSSYEFSQPPQPGGLISGDGFTGRVSSTQCHRFGSSPAVILTHTLTDARGNVSDGIEVTIQKPTGANAPARGADHLAGGALTGGGETPNGKN